MSRIVSIRLFYVMSVCIAFLSLSANAQQKKSVHSR